MSLLPFNAYNGFFGQTSGAIGCASLSSTTPTITGGTLLSKLDTTDWQGYGGIDRPAPNAGVDVGYAGKLNFTNLDPDTVYTWVIEQDGNSVSGSVRTLPATARPIRILMSTCDNDIQWMPEDPFREVRRVIEESRTPVYAFANIDDTGYYDTQSVRDPDTGDLFSDYQDSGGSEYILTLTYLAKAGLIENIQSGVAGSRIYNRALDADRQWVFRNVSRIVQWGDHEVAGDYGRAVKDESTSSTGRDPALLPVSIKVWGAFLGACLPPYLGSDAPPPAVGTGQAWGFEVPGLASFTAFDTNTYSQPWNAQDSTEGTGARNWGRSGTPSYGETTNGRVTEPTLAELNTEFGTVGLPPDQFLGEEQVEGILAYHVAANNPFNWMFTADGISRVNEPWADRWPDEFDRWANGDDAGGTRTPGIFQNPETAKFGLMKGDTHSREVNRYTGDSTKGTDGRPVALGGADGKYLWEFNPGTINGSWNGNFLGPLSQGGERIYEFVGGTGEGNGTTLFASFTSLTITPERQHIELIDSSDGSTLWEGWQYEASPTNDWQETEDAPMPYFGQKKETDSGGVFHTWSDARLDSTNNATDLNGIGGLVLEPINSTFYIKALHVRGSSDSGVNPSAPIRAIVYDASVDVGSPNQARPPAAATPLWTSADFTFPAGTTETQIDITGLDVQVVVSGSARPILTFDFDAPQAGEGAPRIANMEADYSGGNEGTERFTISSDSGATWGSGGAGVAMVAWADYEFTPNDQTGSLPKTDFIGTFNITQNTLDAMFVAGGPRTQEMFNVMAQYRVPPVVVPPSLSLSDMIGTYTIPDIDAVNAILIAGTTRGHEVLTQMVLKSGA